MSQSEHECTLPNVRGYELNYIWICSGARGDRICGKIYQVKIVQVLDRYRKAWKRRYPWHRAWWIESN